MPGRSISAIKEWVEAHQVLVCMVFAYAVLAVAYVLFFAVPRPVTLSFAAQQTCMPQLTLLPTLYQATDTRHFTVTGRDVAFTVAGLPIVATTTCVQPTAQPVE